MIPSIETIVEDLAAGKITKAQAINWLHMHAEGAANDLRDMFAGQALTGFIANRHYNPKASDETLARVCFALADAMLAERAKAGQ